MSEEKTFKMIAVKREWQVLFPELPIAAVNKCVIAEKAEFLGDHTKAEAKLSEAIGLAA